MARILGDYIGADWNKFLVLPDGTTGDKKFTPEDVDISTYLVGVYLHVPFLTAAMRSVTGKDLALAAGKRGMMAVAPRGLSIEEEVEIVEYVKKNAVKVGEIESEYKPVRVYDFDTLRTAVDEARRTGHSNIPVVTYKDDFLGMFRYNPSKHDFMDQRIPIINLMQPYKPGEESSIDACKNTMSDEEIKGFLKERDLRFVPVIDEVGRLDRLVFLQKTDAYKVGGAIDTHPGWEKRAEKLIEAGVDMLFIDTSDAHKPFSREVVEKQAETAKRYKDMGKDCPPLCAGNIVTGKALDYLLKAGAKVCKVGMGPGSTCSTHEELGVGAPDLWSLIDVVKRRDEYFAETGEYIPIIADGGIGGTANIAVALTHADALMGGKLFAPFYESEGDRKDKDGNIYPKDGLPEDKIVAIKIFGEASPEALAKVGDMKRYTTPLSQGGLTTFQGFSEWVPYRGRFKPGVEKYVRTLKESLYHAGAQNLKEYRDKAILVRRPESIKRVPTL